MPHLTVSVGESNASANYEGVTVKSVLEKAGVQFGESLRGKRMGSCLLAGASDGYAVVIALPEIDPAFTEKKIVLAFLKNGQPLDQKDGPYRIVIPDEKRMALGTTGHDVEDRERPVRSVFLDHHFRGFHDGKHGVAFLELQFVGAAKYYRALDEIISDFNDDMGHYIAHFLNGSTKLVSC